MNLDPTIIAILSMENINQFTVVEIRTAYIMVKQDDSLNPVEIRKLVYNELHKLVRNGWLKVSTSEMRKISSFTKTKMFIPRKREVLNNVERNSKTSLHSEFKQELKLFNTDLLEGLGELEVYMSLWEKYPHMQRILKSKYIARQEKNHILKGKINAIGKLLKTPSEKENE